MKPTNIPDLALKDKCKDCYWRYAGFYPNESDVCAYPLWPECEKEKNHENRAG